MVGVIVVDGLLNCYDVVQYIFEKIGSKYFLLFVLLFVDSDVECVQWCNYWLYWIVEVLLGKVDVVFVGIGNIGLYCLFYEDGFIIEQECDEMIVFGVVVELFGVLIDVQGMQIIVLISVCVMSVVFVMLLKLFMIVFVGGLKKYDVVIVVLCGGWLLGFVIDEICVCVVFVVKVV